MAKPVAKNQTPAKEVKAKGAKPDYTARSHKTDFQKAGVVIQRWQKILIANSKRSKEDNAFIVDAMLKADYVTALTKRSRKRLNQESSED